MVNYNLKKADNVRLQLTDQNGSLLESVSIAQQPAGANSYQYQVKKSSGGKAFYISLETSYERATQKVIVQ